MYEAAIKLIKREKHMYPICLQTKSVSIAVL